MCLTAHGETDEIGAETEARALSSRNTNAGRNEVKEDEYAGSSDTEGEHLTHVEALLGDEHSSEGYSETFN